MNKEIKSAEENELLLLANRIFQKLEQNGAKIGNASILLIHEVLLNNAHQFQHEAETVKGGELLKIRNRLYGKLPTGEVHAFDLITIIKEHLNDLDKLIDVEVPLSSIKQKDNVVDEFLRCYPEYRCLDVIGKFTEWVKQKKYIIDIMIQDGKDGLYETQTE